jgi:hypothetical protein
MAKLTLVTDPNCGYTATYLDGKLFWDFQDELFYHPMSVHGYNSRAANFEDFMYALAEKLGFEYDTAGRFQLMDCDDNGECTGYWPEKLEDAPEDTRNYTKEIEEFNRLLDKTIDKHKNCDCSECLPWTY